jgi:hypothetical protein
MGSKNVLINEISSAILILNQKIENLQAKLNELCQSTGNCAQIKMAHAKLIPEKDETNGIDIDTLCKEK